MGKSGKTGRPLLAVALLLAVPALYVGVGCRGSGAEGSAVTVPVIAPEARAKIDSLPGYREPEGNAYLGFSDWYAVTTARDYAVYISERAPSGFRFFTAALGFWTSYCAVNRHVTARYDISASTHVSIYASGIGHSAEYALKGIYENTIGRLSELAAPSPPTAEDLFARKFAFDYGQWLNTLPWHEFPFAARLGELWEHVSLWGPGLVRKGERRFALSAELIVKAASGWLANRGAQMAERPAELELHALMRGLPIDTAPIDRRIRIVETYREGTQLVTLPRSQPFTEIVQKLASSGATFLEIAGNDDIMISLAAPDGWSPPAGVPGILFETQVLSGLGGKRVGMSVPVSALLDVVRAVKPSGARLEHVHDY